MSKRKKKFVVWLSNNTDHEDDEWRAVYASNKEEAKELVTYDSSRFLLGTVYTAREFAKWHGRGLANVFN